MPPTRSLPPSFLLPSWTTRQLSLLSQRRHIYQKTRIRNRDGEPPKPRGESLFGSRRIDITPPITPPTSLFEELFPEERLPPSKPRSARLKPRPPLRFPKLPTFDWMSNIEIFDEEEVQRRAAEKERKDWNIVGKERGWEAEDAQQRREASVLILNCASKTLEESDFYRLSPRGEHIEGWTSGIIKIIPGRDPQTLQSLGHYFILFSSRAAALAYFHRTIELHTLSRSHAPNIIPMSAARTSHRAPLPHSTKELQSLLHNFSLVPPYTRLSLRLLQKPYRPAIYMLLTTGSPTSLTLSRSQSHAQDTVLFTLNIPSIGLSSWGLREILDADGKRRNLLWRFAREGAIVRIGEKADMKPGQQLGYHGENGIGKKKVYNMSGRYILSFMDRAEARRFVREWHKRPCPLQRIYKDGDEPPPIANAEIVW
ncbi:hypothetical protein SBOR_5415 [Sclerotinia borealis F-4128]|uniref:Uncharacterized protein n=1 Tax=Sclerotinia borealis (strain F-4128) TaxID=1432307 RepID=W9CHI1_SCLBF|nr:hypothetical protein SBOR_5415 [Sclerotinia borealis F-4128]